MLTIKLFGVPQAKYNHRCLSGFPTQQPYMLFCYLLVNNQIPHHRDNLATIIWGDYPTQTARKYLRNALWRLRQGLLSLGTSPEDYLLISEDSISFINSDNYWLDIEVFDGYISDKLGLPGNSLSNDQIVDLEKGVDLYTGDLLENVYEDWCLYDRERLHIMYLTALSKLMEFHGESGAYERSIEYGERILAIDPTREKIHRRLMRLYWLLDDRVSAMAQYKRCKQILREELGIRPMEVTRNLYKQIISYHSQPIRKSNHKMEFLPRNEDPKSQSKNVVAYALRKLHLLKAMVNETSNELNSLEEFISQALSSTD